MMTENEFINEVLFKPWVNRGDSFDGMDCYGLIKLYYANVKGFELPLVEGYKEGHRFDSLWRRSINKTWWQCGVFVEGAMVTFYDSANKPIHVGMCISGNRVLHARGSIEQGGKVETHKIATLLSAYKNATFHTLVK